jgi:hypothetical protein
MARCLSLLGMMVFTMGIFALASAAPTSTPTPLPPPTDDDCRCRQSRRSRLATVPALAFHARFSLN